MKTRQDRFPEALEQIWDAVALLRFAAGDLPAAQQHLFLQAVNRLVIIAQEVSGLLEPIDA